MPRPRLTWVVRWRWVLATRTAVWPWLPTLVRLAAGVTLIAVSLSKFTRHQNLVASFERYGLPAPEVAVYVAGAVELLGGLTLLVGLLVRPVGLVVATQFVVALLTGGRVDTDFFHVGLGGLLLAAALFLVWSGAGRWSLDEALAARFDSNRPPDATLT
jgi:putative oxidoreductase